MTENEMPLLIHPELLLTLLQPQLTSGAVWVAVHLPVLPRLFIGQTVQHKESFRKASDRRFIQLLKADLAFAEKAHTRRRLWRFS